ncbi:MAG: nuclease [Rhodospirillaceae bacterium]|nr:MAG: nuclease [Rhodospirillaceae bacterium]
MKHSVTLAAVLCLIGATALADITGQACVVDGNTVSIGGRRAYNRCNGGTSVRLYGIKAPDLAQTCRDSSGHTWPCGRLAAANLLERVRGHALHCRGNSTDDHGRLIAVCFVHGTDINRAMVRQGWAMARIAETDTYQGDETAARESRIGLWQDSTTPDEERAHEEKEKQ